MSHVPLETADIPLPLPVGLYENVMPSFFAMKSSPNAPITFSIDVEPSVETVPPFVLEPQPVKHVATMLTVIPTTNNFFLIDFFIIISFLNFLF